MSAIPTDGVPLRRRRITLAAAGLLLAAGTLAGCGTNPPSNSSQRTCTELSGTRIPASAIGLPIAGGEVTDAKLVPPKGDGASAIPEYCSVNAALHPVDRTAPDIKLALGLPTNWNGRAMMFGGGGYNGKIPAIDGNVAYFPTVAPTPLGRGYATFASDSGHQADPNEKLPDGKFALNDEALHNYTGDALKKTHDAALFLINSRYGKPPAQAYFAGGSTGGREALLVAQRWPTDFAGVLSVAPAWNYASLELEFGHLARVFAQSGAWPNPSKQTLIYNAVMNACDGNDGARDGLISNPAGCHFDPHTLRCPNGTDSGDTCLSDAQIDAMVAASAPMKLNYPLASGETAYPGWPFLSGAYIPAPGNGFGTQPPVNPISSDNGSTMRYWQPWVRYFVTKDPNYNSLTVDPQDPGSWQQRISDLSALQDANNTDLSAFAKAGGKLLLIHGAADQLVSHLSTQDYWTRVQATMGPTAVHDFARFYVIPGFDHWSQTAPFTPGWDSLSALENWAEHGQAPQNPVAADASPGANRTRPLCEYPTWPKHNGTGDMNLAANFTCVAEP